ncbi:polysaccharide biosynthesis/export family protein [Alistipes sp. ZOR0009]|uniref:polysaccharide biosynthesis/export family protein n=1 Tax=Alistipes sp. ZOR0009 TaxID=1339253 RepID=UPI000646323F|nr:polysaccharide biosynthesis/export family protein [Alistipes sp. ZOR0009]
MHKGYLLAGILILAMLLFSCNKHNQLLYMQGKPAPSYKMEPQEYKITPKDEIYIQISSLLNKEVNSIFSNSLNTGNQGNIMNSESGIYVNTYSVNDSGYVEVPLIGLVKVGGKSISQASADIKRKASEFVNDAVVVVKLMSFRVTVIGEVKRPAVITNYHDKLTILEAIAQAGDLSDFADRKAVTIVRNINGESITIPVDLTSKMILSNQGYYLTPGDVVIVDPRKGKTTQMNIPTYSIFLSSISTLVLLLNFMAK